jgi:cell division protease FtsH
LKNRNGLSLSFWLFVFLILVLSFNYYGMIKGQAPKQLSYSEMIDAVQAGEVSEVIVSQKDTGINDVEGVKKDNTKFRCSAPIEDMEFYKILREAKVKITTKLPGTTFSRIMSTFFIYYGPIILLIVLWIFFFNRQQGGAGGAQLFGKSKAKLADTGGKVTFADVAGVNEAKEELQEIIAFLKDPKKFQKLGGKIPKGVLLLGSPGTGKTLLARAVAGEAGVPFFSISGSDFVEMFVGVGAARVRDLFEQGKKNAPCIIFIDEIDAVGRHRGAGLGGGHDEREQTLNALLVEMDGFEGNTGVIIIAATNRPDVLDPALLRPGRFDREIMVDKPDLKGREAILKVHAKKVLLAKDVDFVLVARKTIGFSGADLANLINEAALLAARRNKPAVTMEELEEASDRVWAGPEKKSRVLSEKDKLRVAYHEGGHAVVNKFLPGTDPVHKITILQRGRTMGVTMVMPTEDKYHMLKQEYLNHITMAMGGRAADVVVNGIVDTGAGGDISSATRMAHEFVCKYGMSEKLGLVNWGGDSQEVFLGRDFMKEKNYSEETARMIDSEVKSIIDNAYNEACSILKKNRKFLDLVAETLVTKETIDGAEFEKMYSEFYGKKTKKSRKLDGQEEDKKGS